MKTLKPKVVRPPKEEFTWTAEILKIEVGGEPLRVDADQAKVLRPLISKDIKLKAPDHVYKTDAVTEPGYLLVYRTA